MSEEDPVEIVDEIELETQNVSTILPVASSFEDKISIHRLDSMYRNSIFTVGFWFYRC